MKEQAQMKSLPTIFALAAAIGLGACNASSTAVTAAICTDAAALQSSGVKLNSNQTLALNGIVQSCAATAGGTSFSNGSVALAIIQDAILLQGSGLLSDVHITAQVPADQAVLREIKLHWKRL
jgi:hypothetical protein